MVTSMGGTIREFAVVVCIIASASALLASAQQPTQPVPPRGPLPLDPLTAQERRTAERVARADPRVRELVGERGRLSYIEFVSIKPEQESERLAHRHAEVVFLQANAEYGVRAVVRLGASSTVMTVDKVSERDVPMTADDLEAARKLALESPEVRAVAEPRLEKARVEGLRVVGADDTDPCYRGRCVRLLFKVGNDYLSDPIVVVDLTTSRVTVQRRQP
jgi:hypothetical protein